MVGALIELSNHGTSPVPISSTSTSTMFGSDDALSAGGGGGGSEYARTATTRNKHSSAVPDTGAIAIIVQRPGCLLD